MNIPRHPVSVTFLKLMLVWAEAMGATDVPSFDAYLKATAEIPKMFGGNSQESYTGALGNSFYTSSIPAGIAQVISPSDVSLTPSNYMHRILPVLSPVLTCTSMGVEVEGYARSVMAKNWHGTLQTALHPPWCASQRLAMHICTRLFNYPIKHGSTLIDGLNKTLHCMARDHCLNTRKAPWFLSLATGRFPVVVLFNLSLLCRLVESQSVSTIHDCHCNTALTPSQTMAQRGFPVCIQPGQFARDFPFTMFL
jgi:hypothetical protein